MQRFAILSGILEQRTIMSLNITWEFEDGIRVSMLNGRIDSRNALLFKETVVGGLEEGDRALILDFTSLDYISSAGLRVVLELAKMYSAPKQFSICGLSSAVQEVFEISGFTQIIKLHKTLQQAKESL